MTKRIEIAPAPEPLAAREPPEEPTTTDREPEPAPAVAAPEPPPQLGLF